MMKRKCLRIVSVVLGISMLLAATGCKKNGGATGGQGNQGAQGSSDVIPDLLPTNPDGTPHGDYVLDTDPYYSDTTIKLQIPRNENKDREPSYESFHAMSFLNENIACAYQHTYELTEAEQKEKESLNFSNSEDLNRYYEFLTMVVDYGIAIYSETGELLANIQFPEIYSNVFWIYPLRDGTAIANCGIVDYGSGSGRPEYMLVQFNAKGEILREEAPDPLLDLNNISMMQVIHLENGQFLFYGEDRISLMDENWHVLKKANLLRSGSDIYEIDGKYYEITEDVDFNNSDVRPEMKYRELYIDTLTFSEEKALDPNTPPDYRLIVNNGQALTNDGEGLVKINLITGDRENLFRWGETDIYGLNFNNARLLASGDILLLTDSGIITLHKEATNPYAGRRILKVGINENSEYYFEVIRAYNKRPDSLGRLYVYFPDRNPYGFDAALKADAADRLLLDMKSGDGPDILLNYSDYGQFNTDAILTDLNPYIDGDRGLDRSLYYDNVFRAFEDDGKLYQMPITFSISALLGNPDLLGSISGWTNEEFGQKLQALPDGTNPIIYNYVPGNANTEPLTGTGILLNMLYRDMSFYVDYSRGTVNFDSDEFRKLLENAKLATPKITKETLEGLIDDYTERTHGDPFPLMLQDGICALTPINLRNLWTLAEPYTVCNGQALRIGWPTVKGYGFAADARSSVAISAFSTAKDEAWDFIRYLMSTEVQMSTSSEESVALISVLREREETSLQKELENTLKRFESNGETADRNHLMAAYNQDLIDEFISLVERVSTKVRRNPTIMEIVREEVPAYFDGSKSAEDVSKIIQSRASTVMAESQ
ncbi:MAG: extracellular solute-binding protein [Clostridiales bacterium]|nr:extracellular solute-binding protein [Clostridiales bacterium]